MLDTWQVLSVYLVPNLKKSMLIFFHKNDKFIVLIVRVQLSGLDRPGRVRERRIRTHLASARGESGQLQFQTAILHFAFDVGRSKICTF